MRSSSTTRESGVTRRACPSTWPARVPRRSSSPRPARARSRTSSTASMTRPSSKRTRSCQRLRAPRTRSPLCSRPSMTSTGSETVTSRRCIRSPTTRTSSTTSTRAPVVVVPPDSIWCSQRPVLPRQWRRLFPSSRASSRAMRSAFPLRTCRWRSSTSTLRKPRASMSSTHSCVRPR